MSTGDGDPSRLRADRLLQAGHPREAERLIRDAMWSEPDSPELLAMLSEALLGQGRAAPAAEAARLGLGHHPQDLRLRIDLAQALIRASKSDEAREIADTIVADAPWLWASHYTLGQAWLGQPLPRARLALESAERAHELAPDSPDPLVLIAIAQGRLGDAKAQRAAHQRALALDPSHAHALSNLAATDLARGRLYRAGQGMSSALASSPQESAPNGTSSCCWPG